MSEPGEAPFSSSIDEEKQGLMSEPGEAQFSSSIDEEQHGLTFEPTHSPQVGKDVRLAEEESPLGISIAEEQEGRDEPEKASSTSQELKRTAATIRRPSGKTLLSSAGKRKQMSLDTDALNEDDLFDREHEVPAEEGSSSKSTTNPLVRPSPTRPRLKGPVGFDRQCDVMLPDGRYCDRSLICTLHSEGAWLSVPGPRVPFAQMLTEHQQRLFAQGNPRFQEEQCRFEQDKRCFQEEQGHTEKDKRSLEKEQRQLEQDKHQLVQDKHQLEQDKHQLEQDKRRFQEEQRRFDHGKRRFREEQGPFEQDKRRFQEEQGRFEQDKWRFQEEQGRVALIKSSVTPTMLREPTPFTILPPYDRQDSILPSVPKYEAIRGWLDHIGNR